jgi:hypothetical protein
MIFVTTQMREGDIVYCPEKLNADTFPRLLVLNAQLFDGLYSLGALEADVLTVPLKKVEEN